MTALYAHRGVLRLAGGDLFEFLQVHFKSVSWAVSFCCCLAQLLTASCLMYRA